MYRILIADDEPMIRKGLQKLVEQSGLPIASIRTADNGVTALQQIREERPDFLLTDIRMPKMDGLELCREVAELDEDIQMVVISGFGDFEYAQKCVSYGIKEYLLKPVNKKKFQETLEKLIRLKTRQQSETFVPVTKLEEWVQEMDAAIWELREADMHDQLQRMKSELDSYRLKPGRLNDVLTELHALLGKRLNTRDVFAFHAELALSGTANESESWERFNASIRSLFEALKAKRRGKPKDAVEEAKQYIEHHLAEEVSLEEVAEHIGLNASYFSQLFKQSTNETFVQYRTRRRMEKAKKLLQQPQYRITDISGEVGYADHPHFTKTFKKYTGFLPSEYRQKMGIE
ncbi:response regulator [Paenibacillus allorhizosphaerae]|uniref:Regulator of RpoS n=1 Tax=Paenibacillus allorhizosphaerae TaxID=2849866 RepID=A0ABM8VBV7_9BACL|nr:response regulator [Paenibacillus allorhizosphaerae]CAG7622194.1 Regulator of RpoS [Paenibacillus allorhizosphaerae]